MQDWEASVGSEESQCLSSVIYLVRRAGHSVNVLTTSLVSITERISTLYYLTASGLMECALNAVPYIDTRKLILS